MKSMDLGRFALSIGVVGAAALFAGCGGAQPPIGAPGSMPQSALTSVDRATGAVLIYAAYGCGGICVLSFPQGSVVAKVKVSGSVGGPCSDGNGNVFVPNGSQILEYQHGGTSPIAALSLPPKYADSFNCSVEPTTNNVAVMFLASSGAYVAVFADESGSPTLYTAGIDGFYCGYDNAGNLFVSGESNDKLALSELTRGQSTFEPLTISGTLDGQPGQIQWDGSYLTYEGRAYDRKPVVISRLTISGSVATVVSSTRLNSKAKWSALSWIYKNQVLVPYSTRGQRYNKIGVWPYPHGGKPKHIIKFTRQTWDDFQGITVSVPPSR